ncbi:MAG: TonB-dependent receptor [Verrucomicrobiota bacterium]
MNQPHLPHRGTCRSALALLALLVPFSATAEEAPLKQEPAPAENAKPLEPLVVSALRVPQDPAKVTSSVTVLEPDALQDQGLYQLRDALNQSPGVISTSTGGQTGALGSLFIRGTTTAYSQVVVDGMRLGDSTTPMGNFLAASRTYDVGRIEVLRGPQGAIYGGESIGGVLWLETPRGSGAPSGSATVEAGSFNSLDTHATFQGTLGKLSYFLGGGYQETDNDTADQDFHQGNVALRLEGELSDVWIVGTTYRGVDSYYNNLGNSDDRLDGSLVTLYATGEISTAWTARFHAGYQQEFYDSDSSFGNYGTDLRAGSFSTDQEITLAEDVRLLAGAYVHQSSFENTIGTDESRERYGLHAVLEWDILENLTTTAAVRWEDYDAYGDETTWRFGSIYNIVASGTSLRGGVGSSFRAPSYLDLFGSSFGAGNPNLDAESSLGWDLGIGQEIGKHHLLELTWFDNQITDQIQAFPTPPVNLSGDTSTNGLELGLRGSWLENALNYRIAWTYLHESLSDQPRNAVTTSIDWAPADKVLVGVGATGLSDHSWGGDPIDGYIITRLYGSYQLTKNVKLHARVENALNEDYQLASFFGSPIQGAGSGIYAGITVDW